MKLKGLFEFMPKSKLSASCGKDIGTYPFFTSSNNIEKFINEYHYDGEYLIIGDGGTGNCKYYRGKFSASDHNFVLKPINSTNAKAVKYFLEKDNYEILNKGFKGVGIKNVSKSYVQNIEYKYNQKFNEEDIVNALDELSEKIETEKNNLFRFDEMIKSRFNEMFGDIIEKKNGNTINTVCSSIVRGPFGSSLKKAYLVKKANNTYKVYEQKHAIRKDASIGEYYITQSKFNELKRFEVKSGDIIMSCSGTIGELYKLPLESEKGIINQALLKFTINETLINDCYFLYAMRRIVRGIDKYGATIQNITSVKVIKETNIYLPSIDEQNQFADFVKLIDKLKFNCQQRIKLYQELLDKKMDEYFG